MLQFQVFRHDPNQGSIDALCCSIRLGVVQPDPDHTYTILSQQKEVVRLGEGEFATNQLTPQAIERGVLVLRNFADVARGYGVSDITVLGKVIGQAERLGGIGERVAQELEARTGRESRTVVLGHLLRGGSPTSFDRLVALRFGAAAIRALEAGMSSVMVALAPPTVRYEPLKAAISRMKTVNLESDTIETARDLGIRFGD